MPIGQAPASPSPRIVVVGPCAAGKSTLVNGLRDHGYEALVSGQEHSDIPSLWQHANPDVVIALLADLPTVRARRDDDHWPAWLFARQQQRLRQAIARADVIIDTSGRDAATVLDQAIHGLTAIAQHRP